MFWKIKTGATSLTMDLAPYGLVPGLPYQWIVSEAQNQSVNSGNRSIYLVTSSFRTAIADSTTSLKNEGMEDKSAVNAFLLAKFYERNGLHTLALKQYESAYKLSSGADEFASEYARCLLDQNYTADAERVLASVK